MRLKSEKNTINSFGDVFGDYYCMSAWDVVLHAS